LHREIALKRLPAESVEQPSAQSRFWAEAQIAGQLKHPGFLPVFDLGLDSEGRPFYTTVLLSGRTFGDVIREVHRKHGGSDLAIRRALEQMLQICNAMAYAHSVGIVHRDLKPTNIMIGEYGEVFVIDLGSASVAGVGNFERAASSAFLKIDTDRASALDARPDAADATANAGVPGTPVYMAPELLEDPTRKPDARMDIYALGVVLYELATGRLPYSRPDRSPPDWSALKDQILSGPPVPVREMRSSVSRDLAAICEKAMARDPAARYATMRELSEDIRALLETRVVEASRPGRVARVQKWALRHSRHLALAAMVFGLVGIAVAVGYSLKIQRDHAQQLNHLRDAQIAARNGRWRLALDHLDRAEAAGYGNLIDLGLQRIEAWTTLGESHHVLAELQRLLAIPNLGQYRGAVLLRLGSYELFDRSTFASGVQHVGQALAAGLDRVDESFARGLLAESTPEALGHFRRTLEYNPQHYGAHIHSLGLEFLLGQHERLDAHVALLKVLFPDDPSPAVIEAMRLALDGRSAEADALVAPFRTVMNEGAWQSYLASLRFAAQAAKLFDLASLLQTNRPALSDTNEFMLNAVSLLLNNRAASDRTNRSAFRLAQLPCIKNGLEQGMRGVLSLIMPVAGSPDAAFEQIKAACQKHPESLIPLAAGVLLEDRRPTAPERLRAHLKMQSALFQTAAELPSALPKGHRLARFMAARCQQELGQRLEPPDPQARESCIRNLRWFLGIQGVSAVEYQECFRIAFELGEFDSAREFLVRRELLDPADSDVIRDRIRLEHGSGAYGKALELIKRLSKRNPEDAWTRDMRREVLSRLKTLAEASGALPQ
jgi:tetratricopeptide (TPR) repeat protein/predicted Ser/Thr protein kinase